MVTTPPLTRDDIGPFTEAQAAMPLQMVIDAVHSMPESVLLVKRFDVIVGGAFYADTSQYLVNPDEPKQAVLNTVDPKMTLGTLWQTLGPREVLEVRAGADTLTITSLTDFINDLVRQVDGILDGATPQLQFPQAVYALCTAIANFKKAPAGEESEDE